MANEKAKKQNYNDSMSISATRKLLTDIPNKNSIKIENQINQHNKNDQSTKTHTTLIGTDRVKKTIQTEAPSGRRSGFVKGFDEEEKEETKSFASKNVAMISNSSLPTENRKPTDERQKYQAIPLKDEVEFEYSSKNVTSAVEGLVSRQMSDEESRHIKSAKTIREEAELEAGYTKRHISIDPEERQRRRDALRNGTNYVPNSKQAPTTERKRQVMNQSRSTQNKQVAVKNTRSSKNNESVTTSRRPEQQKKYQRNVATNMGQQNSYENSPKAKDPFTSKRETRFFVFKVTTVAVFSVTVGVMAFLGWQINRLQNELDYYQTAFHERSDSDELVLAMSENEQLQIISYLEQHIDFLEEKLFGLPPTFEGDLYDEYGTNVQIVENIQEIGQRVHIVQPGESLSLISMNLLGTMHHADLIMQANNLPNHNIQPGQTLIIPDLPN